MAVPRDSRYCALAVWLVPEPLSSLATALEKLFTDATTSAVAKLVGPNQALRYPAHVAVTGFFRAAEADVVATTDAFVETTTAKPVLAPQIDGLVNAVGLTSLKVKCASGSALASAFKLAISMRGLKLDGCYVDVRPKSGLRRLPGHRHCRSSHDQIWLPSRLTYPSCAGVNSLALVYGCDNERAGDVWSAAFAAHVPEELPTDTWCVALVRRTVRPAAGNDTPVLHIEHLARIDCQR